MRSHRLQCWLIVAAVLALPVMATAQETSLSGTVSDTTGGALPGVTVRAVHQESGNSFEAVTDERGNYRLPLRIGGYRITAELSGFAPLARTITLLIGQQAVVNLQMSISGVQESVTVTGEAPLLDVTRSSLGGNVDQRQMQELPVNGRNWMELTVVAPGSRINAAGETGAPADYGAKGAPGGAGVRGNFQLTIDGQQFTQYYSGSTGDRQPRFSKDAIAEFEFLSSRFDATQGRSSGVQVNAVTKSGTNTFGGAFSGFFRSDKWNAADFVAKKVLPYQNQQYSGSFGGPIRKDRLHFFGNYEYEREPQTFIYNTPYPKFNLDLHSTHTEPKIVGRIDSQFSPKTRLSFRGTRWVLNLPYSSKDTGGSTSTPSSATGYFLKTNSLFLTLTQALTNSAVNEVKLGWQGAGEYSTCFVKNPKAYDGKCGAVGITLSGFTAGNPREYPSEEFQDFYSLRDDFTYSFSKGGRHTLKTGGEYMRGKFTYGRYINANGTLDAQGGPVPNNIEDLFPDLFDASTWKLDALSPISRNFRQSFGEYRLAPNRHVIAMWGQDDWTISQRLTLNLGVRYDLELGAFGNEVQLDPRFMPGNRPNDTNNIGPRLGASYSLNDRTVIRGGFGVYFATATAPQRVYLLSQNVNAVINFDGRADFASNPWGGPNNPWGVPRPPTAAEVFATLCTPTKVTGCVTKSNTAASRLYAPDYQMPYSRQASVGVERQIGALAAFNVDYVYQGFRGDPYDMSVNLTYDPVTGANYPSTDISRRPYPDWGLLIISIGDTTTNLHSLQTSITKRMGNGWQGSATYTLSGLWDKYPQPRSGLALVPFAVPGDLGNEYSLAISDQRHRAVFNGIWQMKYGFQLSGLYVFGSGQRFPTSWGTDVRNIGGSGNGGTMRLRPNGTIVPRNNFVGDPMSRLDVRLQKRFPLGGRRTVDGLVELFNVFNHANYQSYVTTESSRTYGQPNQSTDVGYAPRTLQLGFRVGF